MSDRFITKEQITKLTELAGEAFEDVDDITEVHADLIIKAMTMSISNGLDWTKNMAKLLKDYMDVITMYSRVAEAQKPQVPKGAKPQEVEYNDKGKIMREIFIGDHKITLDEDAHPPIIT